jgi:hypothetical protein|tara:strand:- start:309 stop:587 length:279 start_codon:yes stop_codon:yes gene_type:complete
MGWLLGYTLGSMAASFVVVKLFDFLVGGAVDSATSAARGIVFVNTWAAVTAKAGMRDVTKQVRRLRLSNLVAKNKLDALANDEQTITQSKDS